MGEIADAIIDGFYCLGCGEIVDMHEPGYARFCSACQRAEKKDRKREGDGPFICTSDKALYALKFWLKELPFFNTATDDKTSRGKPAIGLGYDRDPERDFSKWEPRGIIVCSNDEMRKRAMEVVEKTIVSRTKQERR